MVREQCALMPVEEVTLDAALNRVLAIDLVSAANLPPFDNSAMDGFALRCDGNAIAEGREFTVRGEQAAGDGDLVAEGEGVWEIMTGARMPDGLDAVVPVEQVEVLARREDGRASRIRLTASIAPGRHVRRKGEDVPLGALAMSSGCWLGPEHLMLLAGLGIAKVPVRMQPKVALLCTGRELVDDPAQALQAGQIRNSNGPFLSARLKAAGAERVHRETVTDDPQAFESALARSLASGAAIVISTGAVSMGRYDFVPPTLRALGAEILFHKVSMRPGKPLLFARLAAGQLYFGLPGNPVSSAVGLRFFIEAALRVQLGLSDEMPWTVPLAHDVTKKPGFRLHQKAVLELSTTGQLSVSLLAGQESFKTRPLLDATVWAALPEDAGVLPAGTLVPVFPLGHELGNFVGEFHS